LTIKKKVLTFLFWFFELGKYSLILALVVLLGHYFVITIFGVVGSSMEPSLYDGEWVLVNRLIYQIEKPKRGDIVGLKFPGRRQEKYVKRVIGLPGETIEIMDNEVFINGQKIKESYLAEETKTFPEMAKTLSDDEYFVMGDNRERSNDSRIWGTVSSSDIIGKVSFILYPLDRWSLVTRPSY